MMPNKAYSDAKPSCNQSQGAVPKPKTMAEPRSSAKPSVSHQTIANHQYDGEKSWAKPNIGMADEWSQKSGAKPRGDQGSSANPLARERESGAKPKVLEMRPGSSAKPRKNFDAKPNSTVGSPVATLAVAETWESCAEPGACAAPPRLMLGEGEGYDNEMFGDEDMEQEMVLAMLRAEQSQREEEMKKMTVQKLALEHEEREVMKMMRKKEAAAKSKAARDKYEEECQDWLSQALDFEKSREEEIGGAGQDPGVPQEPTMQEKLHGGVMEDERMACEDVKEQPIVVTEHQQQSNILLPPGMEHIASSQPAIMPELLLQQSILLPPECTVHTQPAALGEHMQQDIMLPAVRGGTAHTQPPVLPQGMDYTVHTQPAALGEHMQQEIMLPAVMGGTAHTQPPVLPQGMDYTAHTQPAVLPQGEELNVHTQPAALQQWVEHSVHTQPAVQLLPQGVDHTVYTQPAVLPSGMENTADSLGPSTAMGPSAVGPSPPAASTPSSSKTRAEPKKRKMSMEEKRKEARSKRMSSSRALDSITISPEQEPQKPAPSMVRKTASLFQTEDSPLKMPTTLPASSRRSGEHSVCSIVRPVIGTFQPSGRALHYGTDQEKAGSQLE